MEKLLILKKIEAHFLFRISIQKFWLVLLNIHLVHFYKTGIWLKPGALFFLARVNTCRSSSKLMFKSSSLFSICGDAYSTGADAKSGFNKFRKCSTKSVSSMLIPRTVDFLLNLLTIPQKPYGSLDSLNFKTKFSKYSFCLSTDIFL